MTLEFKETEAIKFGRIIAIPEINSELKLRIGQLKFGNEENTKKAIEILSSAFGDKSYEIKDFMEKNMGVTQLQKLQSYLVGGDDALELYERQINRMADKMIDNAMEANND